MHRFFDGSQHFLYCNFTVGYRHSTVALLLPADRPISAGPVHELMESAHLDTTTSLIAIIFIATGGRQANYSAGNTTSTPFFFRRITMNFAGSVILALRPTVCGSFRESLPWHEGDLLTAPHLHDNRALQDVDECVCIVTMDGVHRPRRIIDGDHQHLLPGYIG